MGKTTKDKQKWIVAPQPRLLDSQEKRVKQHSAPNPGRFRPYHHYPSTPNNDQQKHWWIQENGKPEKQHRVKCRNEIKMKRKKIKEESRSKREWSQKRVTHENLRREINEYFSWYFFFHLDDNLMTAYLIYYLAQMYRGKISIK